MQNPKTNVLVLLGLVGAVALALFNFLNVQCFVGCILSPSPSCSHRCKGGITIFGTSVLYFIEVMKSKSGTYNDLDGVYPISNAHPWCNKRKEYPDEGVDMHNHPLGWIEQPDGTWAGCEYQTNYPVMQNDVYSYNTYHDVKRLMQEFPRAQYDHKVHRYNEFAFAMTSSAVHQDLNPPYAMLGAPAEIRLKTNPLIRRLFKQDRLGKDTQDRLRAIVRDYVKARDTIDMHRAAFELVWSMIFDIIFPGEPFPFDIMDSFGLYTNGYVKTMFVPTMFTPNFLHGAIARSTNKKVKVHIDTFKRMIQERPGMFGDVDLDNHDCDWNGQPNDCYQYLAHAIMDFFALAGGASLPRIMRMVLFSLYETDGRRELYNGLFLSRLESREFAKSSSKGYLLECLRFFTMVSQYPYWEGPDGTRTKRIFLNIATASKDPNVYGRDAHLFRERDYSFLAAHNMAFADFAKDDTLFDGGNDHHCPAKDAAILIGSTIIEEFGIEDWEVGEDWNPVYNNSIPYVAFDDNIVVERVGGRNSEGFEGGNEEEEVKEVL